MPEPSCADALEAPEAKRPGREALALAGLLVLAAVVRAWAWHRTAVLFNDGPIFLAMAEAIGEGRLADVQAHPFHPGYPALVAAIRPLAGDLESAAVTVSILGGVLGVASIFLLARGAFDREIAWLAAWTVALHPWAVDFSSDVMSDGVYAGVYLAGFALLALAVRRPSLGTGIGLGLAAGLAYLIRPEGVGLAIVGAVLLAARGARASVERPAAMRAALGLVLATTAAMAPLVLPLALETGELRLTRKKAVTALVAGDSGLRLSDEAGPRRADPDADRSIPLPRSAEQVDGGGARKPERSLLGALEAVSRALRTSIASLRHEVAFFAAIGLWTLRRRLSWRRDAPVLISAVLYVGVLVLLVWGAGYVARRHALAALLPLSVYAAVGWRWVHHRLADRLSGGRPEIARRWTSRPLLCLGLVAVLCLVWGGRDLRLRREDRLALREAAEWIAARGEGGVVAAQKLRVAYYAGARFVPLGSGRVVPIESSLRAESARWVVIDEADVDDHAGLASGIGGWLTLRHRARRSGRTALVLEIAPSPAR